MRKKNILINIIWIKMMLKQQNLGIDGMDAYENAKYITVAVAVKKRYD